MFQEEEKGGEVVYEFWYNPCYYESEKECISLHRTREGAERAMEQHMKQIKEEMARVPKTAMDWGVRERIIEE